MHHRKPSPFYCATLGSGPAILTVAANLVEHGIRLSIFDRAGRRTVATLTETQALALSQAFDNLSMVLQQREVADAHH